jgi:hypothetical protein
MAAYVGQSVFTFGADIISDIMQTKQFKRLYDVRRLGSLCYLFEPFHQVSMHDSSLRMLEITCHWLDALLVNASPVYSIKNKDVLCVKIAALVYNIGQRSWLFTSPSHAHELDSVRFFMQLLHENLHILHTLLFTYGLSTEDISQICRFIQGDADHPLGFIVNNPLSKLDVNTLEMFTRCSVFWATDIRSLVWTGHNVRELFTHSRLVLHEGKPTVAFEELARVLVNKYYRSFATLHGFLVMHPTVNAVHLMRIQANIDVNDQDWNDYNIHRFPDLMQRLESRNIYTMLDEMFLTTGSLDEVLSLSNAMIAGIMQNSTDILMQDLVVSTTIYDSNIRCQSAAKALSAVTASGVICAFDVDIVNLLHYEYVGVVRVYSKAVNKLEEAPLFKGYF